MANFTHSVGITYRNDAGTVASTTAQYSGDDESNFNETIAPGATAVQYGWTLIKDDVLSLAIFASAAMTIESNGTGMAADDTITLAAGQLLVWTHDGGMTNPFSTADVANIRVTSTAGGVLKIRALMDVSP